MTVGKSKTKSPVDRKQYSVGLSVESDQLTAKEIGRELRWGGGVEQEIPGSLLGSKLLRSARRHRWSYYVEGKGGLNPHLRRLASRISRRAAELERLQESCVCYLKCAVFYDCREIAAPTIAIDAAALGGIGALGLPIFFSIYPCSDTPTRQRRTAR